jgi:acetyl-CoA synthetase
MPVLPRVKDYDSLYRNLLAGAGALTSASMSAIAGRQGARSPRHPHARPDGRDEQITYGWLRETSNRLANVLRARGMRAAIVSRSCCRSRRRSRNPHRDLLLGVVALPLAALFGARRSYRLQNSAAATRSPMREASAHCRDQEGSVCPQVSAVS